MRTHGLDRTLCSVREDLEATEDVPSAETELAVIRSEPRPRSIAFSRRLAWRIDSLFGFIAMAGPRTHPGRTHSPSIVTSST